MFSMIPRRISYARHMFRRSTVEPGFPHVALSRLLQHNRRLTAGIVAVALSVVPVTDAAARATVEGSHPLSLQTRAAADPLKEARDLYKKGKAQYETFDYAGAIETWTAAYALVPEESLQVKIEISYNLASAHEQAYALDGDRQHLQQAKLLLETYAETYALMDVELTERDAAIARANQRIEELDAKLASTTPATGSAPPPTPAGPTKFSEKNRILLEKQRSTERLLLGSYVVGGLGLTVTLAGLATWGFGSLTATTTDIVTDEEETDYSSRNAGIAVTVIGLAMTGAGIGMLVVALKRRREVQQGVVRIGPSFTPGGVGLQTQLRF